MRKGHCSLYKAPTKEQLLNCCIATNMYPTKIKIDYKRRHKNYKNHYLNVKMYS